jgi:hypothetical protein
MCELTCQIGVGVTREVCKAADTDLKRTVVAQLLPVLLAGQTHRLSTIATPLV